MINKKGPPITFIIRASGESTVKILKRQLKEQISNRDTLLILDENVSFEDKLQQGYALGIRANNEFTVFIDGDILLRYSAIKKIRKTTQLLSASDLGFGLRLWDKFYDAPKFRGLHVYNTKLLERAIKFIPANGLQIRPESYVKKEFKKKGFFWRNDISQYVAGIHDFYQKPEDIYYKFLVRSKRSIDDINKLKFIFQSEPLNLDYSIALKGLEDGEKMEVVSNNKYIYNLEDINFKNGIEKFRNSAYKNDCLIIKKLFQRYKFGRKFWLSL